MILFLELQLVPKENLRGISFIFRSKDIFSFSKVILNLCPILLTTKELNTLNFY